MDSTHFIARKIRFKGRMAISAIAISFLIIIISVSISAGFRKEIRNGVSSFAGDIQLTSLSMNYLSEDDPISSNLSYSGSIESVEGVESITPVIYRAGIVKEEDIIQGIMVKGIPDFQDSSLCISIPSRLSEITGLEQGDRMTVYFIGEKVKVRRFTITSVYPSIVELNETLIAYTSLEDMQRLNNWSEDEVSALEIGLSDAFKNGILMEEKADEIGAISLMMAEDTGESLVSTSLIRRYPQLFDWLDLIDFNVFFILILMSIVAGFNMISGLLILLFQNIATIGTLKSMGMNDRNIAKVFLRVSSNLVLKGMAIGNGAALLFCLIQGTTHFLKLNPANYFVAFVPVSVKIPMILLANVAAYALIMVLLLIPSIFISRVDPAQTMRVE